MRRVDGKTKSIRELLKGVRYSIDYYQRAYMWQREQIEALINDLCIRFLDDYEPAHERKKVMDYGHYFLGSIIISQKDGANYIVDGQQRLTSLTLLLIALRTLQAKTKPSKPVNIDELIFSEVYGEKAFNLDVPERTPCMEKLFEDLTVDVTNESESIQNLVERYADIESLIPDDLRGAALPYFLDWLTGNVHLVEITAFSDDDAYTIFETMNDRGLDLTADEMLKGFLLSNITDSSARTLAHATWTKQIETLTALGEDPFPFFVDWFRSQYATKIRERKKNAKNEDFDRIGTEFHRWLRESVSALGLLSGDDFRKFIQESLVFYSRQYVRLCKAAIELTAGLEHIKYLDDAVFTLYPMLLLAPLNGTDDEITIIRKMRLVARYLDIFLARRIWNGRSNTYSTLQYTMFNLMKEIRRRPIAELAESLSTLLAKDPDAFPDDTTPRLQMQNRSAIHYLLARITGWVESMSAQQPSYLAFMARSGKVRFEVEHIWANKPERHTIDFPTPAEFAERRCDIGGLLLLPKKFNASYGALEYEKKLEHYNSQNLLARTLHPNCYSHNPGFLQMISTTELPFVACPTFGKVQLDARNDLYRQIARHVWRPQLLQEDAIWEKP